MNDETQSYTESILKIVEGVNKKTIMLPEFQRDFRWDIDRTYDLVDSLISNIFVGTIIYGKPSFGMTLREIDQRPRKGKGSNASLKTVDFSNEQIGRLVNAERLRVVLDGQQRITAIYRAVIGLDNVYIILRDDLNVDNVGSLTLEEMVLTVSGEESSTAISVKLSDAYRTEVDSLEDEDLNAIFHQSLFIKKQNLLEDDVSRKGAERIYRRAVRRLIDLYKQEKMLSYYLLDMSLQKFCVFFERSNSNGIQLNFTDILAAKLYHGFNLRKKIEEFESQNQFDLNREIVIRALAYITGVERGGTISIDKSTILDRLDANDFNTHWDKVCNLYVESLNYLLSQHFILSQEWMPSENMIIPLMVFRLHLKSFDQINEAQRKFLEYWYWGSIFANRYSSASNEVIIVDSAALAQIAKGERITTRGYFSRLRSLIQEKEDLFSFTKRSSATYRGILNLLAYHSRGLLDWNSANSIDSTMRLEDHHIYPRAYISNRPKLDMDQDEAQQLVDCVVNRTLIPKLLNIQIGKKPPYQYLSELRIKSNPRIEECLRTHVISPELVQEPTWNEYFKTFLEDRASAIYSLIDTYCIAPAIGMANDYGLQDEIT